MAGNWEYFPSLSCSSLTIFHQFHVPITHSIPLMEYPRGSALSSISSLPRMFFPLFSIKEQLKCKALPKFLKKSFLFPSVVPCYHLFMFSLNSAYSTLHFTQDVGYSQYSLGGLSPNFPVARSMILGQLCNLFTFQFLSLWKEIMMLIFRVSEKTKSDVVGNIMSISLQPNFFHSMY